MRFAAVGKGRSIGAVSHSRFKQSTLSKRVHTRTCGSGGHCSDDQSVLSFRRNRGRFLVKRDGSSRTLMRLPMCHASSQRAKPALYAWDFVAHSRQQTC